MQGQLEYGQELGERMRVVILIVWRADFVVSSKEGARIDGSGRGVDMLILVPLRFGALDGNVKI